MARSPSTHGVILDPTVLGVADRALAHATNYQLHCTQIIDVGPGSNPQPIHRDQWAFDFFPFPKGFDSTFSTMWALTDFTAENGATRVVPGSHQDEDRKQFAPEDALPAEMKSGSVLLYTGSLYHGGGENQSDGHRVGLIVHYSLAWLRQEENQYLGCPQEVLDELPEQLLRLMGYAKGSLAGRCRISILDHPARNSDHAKCSHRAVGDGAFLRGWRGRCRCRRDISFAGCPKLRFGVSHWPGAGCDFPPGPWLFR